MKYALIVYILVKCSSGHLKLSWAFRSCENHAKVQTRFSRTWIGPECLHFYHAPSDTLGPWATLRVVRV